MIRRRAVRASIHTPIGNQTFRATGITAYLSNGGALEHAHEAKHGAFGALQKLSPFRVNFVMFGPEIAACRHRRSAKGEERRSFDLSPARASLSSSWAGGQWAVMS